MILHFSSTLTGCWVHLLSPIFCLPKFAHMWVITCFRGSPKKPLRMGRGQHIPCTVQLDAQSLNAPLLPVAKNSSYEAGRTKDKDHHDYDMSSTTHHTTPPNQQRTTRTRHDTAPHNKKTQRHTRTRTCMYIYVLYMYMYLYMHVYVYVCVCICMCMYMFVSV